MVLFPRSKRGSSTHSLCTALWGHPVLAGQMQQSLHSMLMYRFLLTIWSRILSWCDFLVMFESFPPPFFFSK